MTNSRTTPPDVKVYAKELADNILADDGYLKFDVEEIIAQALTQYGNLRAEEMRERARNMKSFRGGVLLSCPFCLECDPLTDSYEDHEDHSSVICGKCEAHGPRAGDHKEAGEKWNQRFSIASQQEVPTFTRQGKTIFTDINEDGTVEQWAELDGKKWKLYE